MLNPADMGARDWSEANLSTFGRACTRRCHAIPRCQFVSFSLTLRKCAWYVACDTGRLRASKHDYYTASLPMARGCTVSEDLPPEYTQALAKKRRWLQPHEKVWHFNQVQPVSLPDGERLFVKSFTKNSFNRNFFRSSSDLYHNEVTSLCRISTANPDCQREQWPRRGFPELAFRNDSMLIVGTVIHSRRGVAAASHKKQIRCLWDTLEAAGVVHRDVYCKNTRVSREGEMTLFDFDGSYIVGDMWSNYEAASASFFAATALTYANFEQRLLPCFPPANKMPPRSTTAFWEQNRWWEGR